MTRTRYQVFFEEDACRMVDRLCKRYGWTPSQLMERLLRFYCRTQLAVVGYTVQDEFDSDGTPLSVLFESLPEEGYDAGDCYVSIPEGVLRLVELIQEGLVPIEGFESLDQDDEERNSYHG